MGFHAAGGLQRVGHDLATEQQQQCYAEEKDYVSIQRDGLPWWLSGKECLPIQEMQVQSLDQEDLLEKEMATHSSILAWKIPWTEEPGRLQSMGSQRVGHD